MSFRASMVRLRDNMLKLTDPQHFDIRPHRLIVRTRTWAGRQVGREGGTITAATGDTWASLAMRLYGTEIVSGQLREANGGAAGTQPVAGTVYRYPAYFDADLAIAQRYTIENVSAQFVASSGGRYRLGDLRVVGISPAYYDTVNPAVQIGGYTVAQLNPPTVTGREIIYVLEGPSAGEYRLVKLHADKPFGYELVLTRELTTP